MLGAERAGHPARIGGEGGLGAGELDEQGRDGDSGCAADEVGVGAEPGPRRQPRFGGGEPAEAGQAVVDQVGALAGKAAACPRSSTLKIPFPDCSLPRS